VPLSSTGLDFPFFFIVFDITVLIGVVALAFVLTRRPVNRLGILAWLLHPLAAVAVLLLFLGSQSPANPLFRLRFHLSQPALEEAAVIVQSQRTLATPTWVGLFPVRRIDVFDPEIRFVSEGCGVVDECGLVYIPGPTPRGWSKTKLKPLGGSWYYLYVVF